MDSGKAYEMTERKGTPCRWVPGAPGRVCGRRPSADSAPDRPQEDWKSRAVSALRRGIFSLILLWRR